MSSRKLPGRTPEIRPCSSKSTSKKLTNSSSRNFHSNTTSNLHSRPRCSPIIPGSLVPENQTVDWDLECQLSTNKYLLALLNRDVTERMIQKHEDAIDEQLASQAELLKANLLQNQNLDKEIEDTKLAINITKELAEFNQFYESIDDVIKINDVSNNLDTCIESAEIASNKLYLKNIKEFKSQSEYDKFEELLEKTGKKAEKLIDLIGNADKVKVLGDKMEEFTSLRESILKKQKSILDLQKYISLTMFKVISNKFSLARD